MPNSPTSPSALRWFDPLPSLRISPAVILIFFAALITLARLHTYFEPMDRDLGDYATVGHEMHYGKLLYTDLPDQKPPAIHLTYYAAEALVGYNRSQVYFLTVTASLITLIAAYAVCVLLTGSRAAGLWAAAFWTVISGHLQLEGNQPNTEVFMNAFTMAGFAFLVRGYRQPNAGWGTLLLAGACFAWASLYKQVIVVTPAFLGLAYLLVPPPGRSRWRALSEVLLVGAVIVAAWGSTIGYFWWQHRLDAFVRWMVTFNQGYAGSLTDNLRRSFDRLYPPAMEATLPLIVLAGVGIVLGIARRFWAPVLFLISLAVSTQIAVSLPGKFFPHYYQLWFPWLIVGAGIGMAVIEVAVSTKRIAIYAGVVILGLLLAEEVPNYLLSADQWSEVKFGSQFIRSNAVAKVVNLLLKPDETFFQFANDAEIYPVTGRRPISSILGTYGLNSSPIGRELCETMISDLTRSKPDLLIITRETVYVFRGDLRVTGFIEKNYTPMIRGDVVPAFLLMARNGSDLQARGMAAVFEAPEAVTGNGGQ